MLAPYPDAAAAMTVTTPPPPHGLQCNTWIAVGESPDTVTVKWLCVSAGTMRAMQCAVFSDESTIILKIATLVHCGWRRILNRFMYAPCY